MRASKLIAIFLAVFAVMAQAVALNFSDIKYWVGEGSNQAVLVVQWNDGETPTALAWGYKWDGKKTSLDLIKDIAKEDPRFFYIGNTGTAGGLGFVPSGSNIEIGKNGKCQSPDEDGLITVSSNDYDGWALCDGTIGRFAGGWNFGYWNISSGSIGTAMTNNSVHAFNFILDWMCMYDEENPCPEIGTITPVTPPGASAGPTPEELCTAAGDIWSNGVCNLSLAKTGAGTQSDPYKISIPEQLRQLDSYVGNSASACGADKYFVLTKDIDLTNYLSTITAGWTPIGTTASLYFCGKVDGKGYKVSGLWTNRNVTYTGLFGYIKDAVIENIGVVIDNTKGVKGTQYVGGLVGYSYTSTISNSFSEGNVQGNNTYVGGLAGYNGGGTISNSYATGDVSSTSTTASTYVGGLVGTNVGIYITSNGGTLFAGVIKNSYASGKVSGLGNVGGLAGCNCITNTQMNPDAKIINSYAMGKVTGTGTNVGGLVGLNTDNGFGTVATIDFSYYNNTVNPSLPDPRKEGKSTEAMKVKSTYVIWNFAGIWEIYSDRNSGYPILTWQIPNHIGNAIVAAVPDYTWTGSPLIHKSPVTFNGKTLTEGTDFEYGNDNNIQINTAATFKIIGKGSYSGTKTVEFKINPASCGTGIANGAGTQANPYKITSAKELDALSNCRGTTGSGKYFELQNNIDLGTYLAGTSAGWQPIGITSNSFYGKLNGKGHKITGLWINRPTESRVGLFGSTASGFELSNIGLEIDSKGVVGGQYTGGLVGDNRGTKISNIFVKGNVNGTSNVGGLAGYNIGAPVSNSYFIGNVSGTGSVVGGLVAYAGNVNSKITNSYAVGSVTGTTRAGLIATLTDNATSTNNFFDKEKSGGITTGTGAKSTEEMKNKSTYSDWDLNTIWAIASDANDGYPILRWQFEEYAKVSAILPQTHTGSAIEPPVTVEFAGDELAKGTDYEVSYSNNTAIGTATITITGKGNPYFGSIETTFDIEALTCPETTPIPKQCSASLFAGGDGSFTNPYQISTPRELQSITRCSGQSHSNKFFVLKNDIDLTTYLTCENDKNKGWIPIGDSEDGTEFRGSFNGNGHKVTGLWINRPSASQVGLFGYAAHAQFRNVGVEIDDSKGGVIGGSYTGGLVGWNVNGSIKNSYAKGKVQGKEFVGGLAGHITLGTIKNSFATGKVIGEAYVGGLLGNGGTIINSYAIGEVQGSSNVGGLAGGVVKISNSYAAGGTVSGTSKVGGLTGSGGGSVESVIVDSYYDKTTSGQSDAGKGDGKSTSEMKAQATYKDWNFDGVWEIKSESYPTLLWQNPNHIANAQIENGGVSTITWDGTLKTPTPNIIFKGNALVPGKDFDYSYDNNRQIGTATLIITGKGSYEGQKANIDEFGIGYAACGVGFAGGKGTQAEPWQIKEAKNLEAIANCTYAVEPKVSRYYELMNDIDLTDYLKGTSAGWQPIGWGNDYFYGKFNGNGHKITGLWTNRPLLNHVGLFGVVGLDGTQIRNLGLEINTEKGGVKGYSFVGGLVGYRNYEPTISNVYVKGKVQGGGYYVGLLAGSSVAWEGKGLISNSFAIGEVQGGVFVGGLVGDQAGEIDNCYAMVNVQGNSDVGGLAGHNRGTITNSYATGTVMGTSNVGGFAGSNASKIISSYYNKSVNASIPDPRSEGKTTEQMKTQGTYANWNFEEIWEIKTASNDGYPTLLWQNPIHLAHATLDVVADKYWTGSPITPEPTIKVNGVALVKGTDFEYAYDNNILIGTATLRIKGKEGSSYAGQTKTADFNIVAASCGTGFAGGNGTAASPYQIKEAKNLDAINNCKGNHNNGNYELIADIDLTDYLKNTSEGWKPISWFDGNKLNGNGYKVTGLWFKRPLLDYAGLFGNITNGAEIKNIGLELDDAKGGVEGAKFVGGLVGSSTNKATISNSYVKGKVKGTTEVGGLVGYNVGTITNSYARGSVAGTEKYLGGLVGENDGGTIQKSYAAGTVTAPSGIGNVSGLVGKSTGTITDSYYDQTTSGKTDARGTPKTTEEMKTQSTYANWDFGSTWAIASLANDGYPILITQAEANCNEKEDSYWEDGKCKKETNPVQPVTPAFGSLIVKAIPNGISIENLPANTKVEIFNLQGRRIYSSIPENPKILAIGVQTGMYVIKVGSQTMRIDVR